MFQGAKILNQYQNRMSMSPEDQANMPNAEVSRIQNQDDHLQSNDDLGTLVKDLQIQPRTQARMNED